MNRGQQDPVRVLFLNTPTFHHLGADTAVHARVLANLDRDRHQLFVACKFRHNGVETPMYQTVKGMPSAAVVDANLGPELVGRTRARKLIGLIETLPAVVTLVKLSWMIRRRGIDVVYTSDRPRDAFAAVWLSRVTRARCVIHAHVGFDPSWMSRLLTWSIPRADAVIAVSRFVASTLPTPAKRDQRIAVVPNAAETDAFRPGVGRMEKRQEVGADEETVVFITVCRLFPSKGPGDLIRAMARVREQRGNVLLLVVGLEMEPGYADELRRLTDSLGLSDVVLLLGWRPDVPELMAAADVFAMPSVGEPFGLVYLEAMATELPVVALASGGTPEVVEHGSSGLLSEPGDIEALASNLLALATDPDLRRAMGARGRDRVLRFFTSQRLADEVADVFRLVACDSPAVLRGDDHGSEHVVD